MAWLNVGSLVLGLIAWILPVVALLLNNEQEQRKWVALSFVSLSACAISICMQILYTRHLVQIEDWSALLDTMGAVAFAATVLLIVTLFLNVITLIRYQGRIAK